LFIDGRPSGDDEDKSNLGEFFWRAGHDKETAPRFFYEKIQKNPEHTERFREEFANVKGNVPWVSLA